MESADLGSYSSLRRFREFFQTGTPVLTYHKVGPRPFRARLKGLYLSPRLFAKQMRELREAGYTSGSLLDCGKQKKNDDPSIVVTFDDGYTNVFENAVEPLAQAGFKAIQFLLPDLLGKCNEWDLPSGEVREPLMDVAQVREWLAAGHEIGSHTLTHPFLTRLPWDVAREEISASKKKLEDLFGRPIEHFCYPYGDWNPAVRDLVMEAGYRTACTVDFGINTPETPRLELKRITARYPSRSWKTLQRWFSRFRSNR